MKNLRPKKLSDIIGQQRTTSCLEINIAAAKQKSQPLAHTMLHGVSGCGKSTIALAIANEFDSNFYTLNGGGIRNKKDIIPLLMLVEEFDIIFIDEIHRIPIRLQEVLFPVMEDFRLDIGKGITTSLDIAPVTFVGATTNLGILVNAFRKRFPNSYKIELYKNEELYKIVEKNAKTLGIPLDKSDIYGIVERSRGVPRVANNLLRWVSDYLVKYPEKLDLEKAMSMIGIDKYGLDSDDRLYLSVLKRFGKPVGLNTLVSATGLDRDTIETIVEPFLISKMLIDKTSKGRVLL